MRATCAARTPTRTDDVKPREYNLDGYNHMFNACDMLWLQKIIHCHRNHMYLNTDVSVSILAPDLDGCFFLSE